MRAALTTVPEPIDGREAEPADLRDQPGALTRIIRKPRVERGLGLEHGARNALADHLALFCRSREEVRCRGNEVAANRRRRSSTAGHDLCRGTTVDRIEREVARPHPCGCCACVQRHDLVIRRRDEVLAQLLVVILDHGCDARGLAAEEQKRTCGRCELERQRRCDRCLAPTLAVHGVLLLFVVAASPCAARAGAPTY